MVVPEWDSGGKNYYQACLASEVDRTASQGIQVTLTNVDALALGCSRAISFIKCNVEKSEYSAIIGATKTIQRYRPAWHMLVSGDPDDSGSNATRTMELMKSFGYQVYWYRDKQLVERHVGDDKVKYFFLAKEHLDRLSEHGLEILEGGLKK